MMLIIIQTLLMNNRWGRQLESKGSLRSSGQNNINININFNAVKDKQNAFTGKKIDNFIEISNQSKPNVSRPNVSMETLKQKKKKIAIKQQNILEPDLQRKRSKSKIINEIQTPEKIYKDRQSANSKSIGKKSTKKRSAKSYDNLRKFYGKVSPLQNSRRDQVSQSAENSKQNSRSKSKSRSKSNKKLIKNGSKSKIPTNSTNTRAKNSSHNSKKDNQQQKNGYLKTKKSVVKKVEKIQKIKSDQPAISQGLNKKPSMQRIPRKKLSQDEQKKINRVKTPKKKSKQKQSKSLKRLPLFYQQQQQVFDEQGSYKKMKKQAQRVLYEQEESKEHKQHTKQFKKQKKQKYHVSNCQKPETSYERYIIKTHTYEDMKFLTLCATNIQRHWRGYKARTQFINELNMMNHKIQITKNKIANLDPRFWDDAQSNSILKADDAQSVKSSEVAEELPSQIDKSISENSSTSRNKMRKNRVVENSFEQQEMIERITKLQQILKKQQAKAQKLQQENKELKINLQKVSVSSVMQSGGQSMQESLKSDQSWEVRFKHEQDPFMEESQQSQQSNNDQKIFSIRMPVKKQIQANKQKQERQKQKQKQKEKIQIKQVLQVKNIQKEGDQISQDSNNQRLKKIKNKVQKFQCSSPKYAVKISINSNLLEMFQKKEDQIKENYEKKANIYDRMLSDSIFSPRTYSLKKNQLQQKFKLQAESIRNKKQQIARVAQYIKQIQEEQPKPVEKPALKQQGIQKIDNKPSSIIREPNHVIEDFGSMNLHSHRSKSESEDADQIDQFQSSVESEKSSKNGFHRSFKPNSEISNQIQQKNGEAIRIFQQISQQNKQQNTLLEENKSKVSSSEGDNSSQVSVEPKKPKGLQTALLFIRQYCLSFIQFIRNSEEHRSTFIQGICTPIIYDSMQLLRAYRTTTTNQNDSSYNSQQKEYIYPFFKLIYPKSQSITRDAFNQFNQVYEKLQGQCFYPAERQFFLNSLLDAFNESLDYRRPCSFYGQPPPWISEHRALKNFSLTKQQISDRDNFIASQKFDEICGVSIARVMQWSASLCGFIPESPQMENVVIQQQQINHIRQTRIALMLEKDLLQNQEGMLDSIIEQTEVKLHLSEVMANQMFQQALQEFTLFFK